MKRRLSGTNFSSENNLPTFWLNAPFALMMTEAKRRQVISQVKVGTRQPLFHSVCRSQLRSHRKKMLLFRVRVGPQLMKTVLYQIEAHAVYGNSVSIIIHVTVTYINYDVSCVLSVFLFCWNSSIWDQVETSVIKLELMILQSSWKHGITAKQLPDATVFGGPFILCGTSGVVAYFFWRYVFYLSVTAHYIKGLYRYILL